MSKLPSCIKLTWPGAAVALLVLFVVLIIAMDALARTITGVAPIGDTHWWGLREAVPGPSTSAVNASRVRTVAALTIKLQGAHSALLKLLFLKCLTCDDACGRPGFE